ncbi:MAG: pyroglutamyl-peptidase I [Candidatus Heimdallarchaeaceae archaeon]
MQKILLTGFEPFGGSKVNPSLEVAKTLNDKEIDGFKIIGKTIPLVFDEIKSTIENLIQEYAPSAVISVGQSGRGVISLERVAINLADAKIAYNCGTKPFDQVLEVKGPVAYFTTLSVRAIISKLHEAGIPAEISYSAGTYGCNQLFYHLMHYVSKRSLDIPAGFIHVPPLPQQVVEKRSAPSMCLDLITHALEIVIETTTKTIKERKAD